ncbi:AAA family ATPase, partial [Paeniclostridium sordellii]|nr:AAA family ATPase [Paeniclostridium sordellii]
ARAYREQEESIGVAEMPFDDRLAMLVDAEWDARCLLRRFCYAVPRAAATPFRGWPIRADAATVRPTRGARAPLLA